MEFAVSTSLLVDAAEVPAATPAIDADGLVSSDLFERSEVNFDGIDVSDEDEDEDDGALVSVEELEAAVVSLELLSSLILSLIDDSVEEDDKVSVEVPSSSSPRKGIQLVHELLSDTCPELNFLCFFSISRRSFSSCAL